MVIRICNFWEKAFTKCERSKNTTPDVKLVLTLEEDGKKDEMIRGDTYVGKDDIFLGYQSWKAYIKEKQADTRRPLGRKRRMYEI